MTGFVYAIGGDDDRVKIGWSSDPVRRLTKLKSDCPTPMRLMGLIAATQRQEREIQELLDPWRLPGRREWFRLDGAVAAFVSLLPQPKPKMVRGRTAAPSSHPLATFLSLRSITRTDFAERIGVTPAAITGYCNGTLWPKREVMHRIVAETNGEVTADDFLQTPRAVVG